MTAGRKLADYGRNSAEEIFTKAAETTSQRIVKMKIRESVCSSINDAATSRSKKFLKKAELAAILGVQTRTVETWVRKRKISSIKAGHRTQLFQLEKVIRDLSRFEIHAIGGGK